MNCFRKSKHWRYYRFNKREVNYSTQNREGFFGIAIIIKSTYLKDTQRYRSILDLV
jgi:hypothetical protein